jgi:ribosomal protein L37AE/L43A
MFLCVSFVCSFIRKVRVMDLDWKECTDCGDAVRVERWNLGFHLCLFCGEDYATKERRKWTVVQEYTKGNYQFVTNTSAQTALKQTNPKETRA